MSVRPQRPGTGIGIIAPLPWQAMPASACPGRAHPLHAVGCAHPLAAARSALCPAAATAFPSMIYGALTVVNRG